VEFAYAAKAGNAPAFCAYRFLVLSTPKVVGFLARSATNGSESKSVRAVARNRLAALAAQCVTTAKGRRLFDKVSDQRERIQIGSSGSSQSAGGPCRPGLSIFDEGKNMTSAATSHRSRLSVAMLVCNEEATVLDTIASVRAIADEIVVLDTGSTDATALVKQTAWRDDFSAVRNEILDHATGQWILWLNAGEKLDAESASKLQAFVRNEADPARVYSIMVELPALDPAASREQSAQFRLMPNRNDLWFEGRVRETLKPSIEQANLGIDMAPGRIVRHLRNHDPKFKKQRAQRNLRLASLETESSPQTQLRVLLATGEAASDLGDRGLARDAFSQAVQLAPRASVTMLEAYYGLLTTFDGDGAASDRQIQACAAALEVFPFDAQLLCAMGSYMQAANRIDYAARSFGAAVKYGQVTLDLWHLSEIAEIVAGCYAVVLQMLGQHALAVAELETAYGRYPDSSRVQRHLLDAYIRQGRLDDAVRVAQRMTAGRADQGSFCDVVRGACKAVQQEWTAALGYLQSAYAAGNRDPLCFRWLCFTLVSGGHIDGVESLVRQWQEIDPAAAEIPTYLEGLKNLASQSASKTADGHWLRVDSAPQPTPSVPQAKTPEKRRTPAT
jgi:tetratricopeptide (TPR) repeat protein